MRARLILAILVALFAVLTLLDRFAPLEVLLTRIALPFGLAAAEALAIVGTGALLRRAHRLDLPLDFLVGYPAFGTVLFLVGLASVAAVPMTVALIAGAVAGGWFLLRAFGNHDARGAAAASAAEVLAKESRDENGGRSGRRSTELAAFAVVAMVLAFGFLAATRTPSSPPEVSAHLAIPYTWALEGRVVSLPLISAAHGPLGVESADLVPFALLGRVGAGLASHFLHWLAALATVALIVRRTRSWLVTAAIATTPALATAAGLSLPVWPLLGLFIALYIALEEDSRLTASAATAAGLLTSYAFLPFAIAAWGVKRRLPHWIAALGLVFFIRNLTELPDLFFQRTRALADYVLELAFVEEALGASIVALPVLASGGIGIAAALLALALFFLAPSARLLVPFLGVATMSAAPALQRRTISILVAIAIAIQTFVALTPRTRDEKSAASIAWLNSSLPRTSRTLVIGVDEPYSFTRRVRTGDAERLSRYFALPAPEAVRERLRADGITHVAVIEAAENATPSISPEAQRMLAQTLDRYAGNVTSRGDVTVFALR